MVDDHRALYIISVAAELAGVHPQTLRIYERKGLIEPSRTGPQPPLLRPRHRAAPADPGAHQRRREPGRGPADPRAGGRARGDAGQRRRDGRRPRPGTRRRERAVARSTGATAATSFPSAGRWCGFPVADAGLRARLLPVRNKLDSLVVNFEDRIATPEVPACRSIRTSSPARPVRRWAPPSRWRASCNHSQVTPEHLLAALLGQPESVVLPVLERIGVWRHVARPGRRALGRIAKVYGDTTQQAQLSRRRLPPARGRRRRAVHARRRLPLDRAPAARDERGHRRRRRPPPRHGRRPRRRARRAPGGTRQPSRHQREPRGAVPGAREVRPRSHRGRPQGQARPRDRPRRGDPPGHPGAVAPHQEQPRADRRARRRARPPSPRASRGASSRATCPRACATSASSRSTSARWSPAPSTAASSKSA